jgi:tetratricopeptide (TPR) repeat protein/transcriptional regulator with XRE-family HTH domain
MEPGLTFADLLRQLRTEARLTQEELAEEAGLSPRSVSDLERGINRTARKDSALMLATALKLSGEVQSAFVAAARGRAEPEQVLAVRTGTARSGTAQSGTARESSAAAATRTLPRDIGGFTGRDRELAALERSLDETGHGGLVGIHAIDGMAGIGKTTFAVHAAHRLAARFPDGQFFLPLHAHTAGQPPVDSAGALADLLATAGVAPQHIPPGLEARAAKWRDYVAGKKILLLLDDVAGHEQVRPLLPGSAGSLVLVTSRRRLTALEDAVPVSIDILAADEALALLIGLAGRADLAQEEAACREITRLCGYLPLAIAMLARRLRHHPAMTATALTSELGAARDRLAVMRAEDLSVAAAFDLSYRDLTPAQQRLFRRLGLAFGPDLDAYAAAALDDITLEDARLRLEELYDQHLITEPAPGRYLLHDLLREYARALAAGEQAQTRPAVERLINFYAHVAAAACRHIATWTTAGGRLPPADPPACVPRLTGAADAAGWLEAERPNLHAAVGYAAAEGLPLHSVAIAASMGGYLRARGHWQQAAGQYRTALGAARAARDRSGEAGMLDELGLLQQLTGDYQNATATLTQAIDLFHELGDKSGEAYARNHLGLVYGDTSDFRASLACHQQALELALAAGDRLAEAVSLTDLGGGRLRTGEYPVSIENYRRALSLFRELGSKFDEADALTELGYAMGLTGDHAAALAYAREALELWRQLGDRLGQAWALCGLGETLPETGEYAAATACLEEALEIHRDLGSRYGEIVVLNSLAELASRTSDTLRAGELHREALAAAHDLGAPGEEARALAGLGRCRLADDPPAAGQHLRDALAIYQRIEAAEAQLVQDILDEHSL